MCCLFACFTTDIQTRQIHQLHQSRCHFDAGSVSVQVVVYSNKNRLFHDINRTIQSNKVQLSVLSREYFFYVFFSLQLMFNVVNFAIMPSASPISLAHAPVGSAPMLLSTINKTTNTIHTTKKQFKSLNVSCFTHP